VDAGVCVGLADVLLDHLDAHDAHAEVAARKDALVAAHAAGTAPADADLDALIDEELALRNAAKPPETVCANGLKALVHLSRSKPARAVIAAAGCVRPACRLLDPSVFSDEIAAQAAMVVINCCTGPLEAAQAARRVVVDHPTALESLVRSMNDLGAESPHAHRAAHVLKLVSDEEGCDEKVGATGPRAFEGLVALLAAGAPDDWTVAANAPKPLSADGRTVGTTGIGTIVASPKKAKRKKGDKANPFADALFVKNAAQAVNNLCAKSVENKIAFHDAGGIPPLMRHAFRDADDPVTETVVCAVSTLAMDNDTCDQPIYETGVLPRLVALVGDPAAPHLNLPAIVACMHMARDSRDAKRQLTAAGVIPKLKRVIDDFDPEAFEETAKCAVPAISCLVNIAIDSEYWGQAELSEEGCLAPVARAFQVAPPTSSMSQVCAAFVNAFVTNNPENQFLAREAGVLPMLAYHHLKSRAGGKHGKHRRESKEALVVLGAAVDMDEQSRDVVSGFCGEALTRECVMAGGSATARKPENAPPEITDAKRKQRENATLLEVQHLAEECGNALEFVAKAKMAWDERRKRRAREIFDAEAALEKKLVEQLASREKELQDAEASRNELRKAQARVGKAMSSVKKEVNEARAAKKDWEAACRALDRKRGVIGKERDRLAEEMEEKRRKIAEEKDETQKAVAEDERMLGSVSGAAGSTEAERAEAKERLESNRARLKDLEKRSRPNGDPELAKMEKRLKELDKGLGGDAIKSLERVVAEKKAAWDKEQREADEATAKHAAEEAAAKAARADLDREEEEAREAQRRVEEAARESERRAEMMQGLTLRQQRQLMHEQGWDKDDGEDESSSDEEEEEEAKAKGGKKGADAKTTPGEEGAGAEKKKKKKTFADLDDPLDNKGCGCVVS
jgi:hypothetical protein